MEKIPDVSRNSAAISIYKTIYKIGRNCLAYMLDFIVMQMSKVNRKRAISG